MALNVATCVTAIVAAENALAETATESQRMTALVQAIFDHIKANMVVTSSGTDPQGGSVTSTSTGIV